MKIYRLYHIEQDYVPSNYVDKDGYTDDYYDTWIEHDYTLGYFANKQAINRWIEDNIEENGMIVIDGQVVCYDEELQIEEIKVIE